MLLIISSGNGPAECEKAVYEYLEYLKREFGKCGIEYKCIETEAGTQAETYKSIILKIRGDVKNLEKYTGTIKWINESSYRKNHKRKNWYIKSFLTEENLEMDKDINKDTVEIKTMRSSGNGGQNVNKLESAVRIKHIPTGISIVSREERTQYSNKKAAVKRLEEKLNDLENSSLKKKEAKIRSAKNKIERGNPDLVFTGEKFKRIK